ncbi:hypothetical protein AAG570_004185 [Ranatra chinensis]|uniref:Uncharacterized protein n=1 Tax=Ranatra chinensis TaxID=642074 RepID=A0ABD0Y317_9HEMI
MVRTDEHRARDDRPRGLANFPKPTPEGYRVAYAGLTNTDPTLFDMVAVLRLFHMIIDASVIIEGLSRGFIVILDAKGVTTHHAPLSSLNQIHRLLIYVQIKLFYDGSMDPLYEEIPKEILPYELGGTLGPMEKYQRELQKKVEGLTDWYIAEENQRSKSEYWYEYNKKYGRAEILNGDDWRTIELCLRPIWPRSCQDDEVGLGQDVIGGDA